MVAGVRRLVSFSWTNLTDLALAHRVAGMDLVLCRNVMIYLGSLQYLLARISSGSTSEHG